MGSKYIVTTFNISTWKKYIIICVYRAHSCLVFKFLNNSQTIIQHSLEHCPILIMGDFNVDIKQNNNKQKINKNY
jgi:hypothetical protein